MTSRTVWRAAAAAALLTVAALAGAPYVRADGFSTRIRAALEAALRRKVEIGEVRLHLLTGPAFTLRDVRIFDDPAFGIEPVAYVTTLYARPRLLSLWSGKLEFRALKLDDPSVNLVRTVAGRWNFEPLVAGAGLSTLPKIEVSNGRINFKFGETKSLFYLTNADFEILPPAAAGEEGRIRFTGEPSRADRQARGLGSLVATGRWRSFLGEPATAEAGIQLEKTALGEIITLLAGRDAGIHGLVSSRVQIAGPLDDLQIAGKLDFQDVRRWDSPAKGTAWPLAFRGRLNLPGQTADFESRTPGAEPPPLSIRLRATNFLSAPRWGVSLTAVKFPVAPLVELLRNLGVALPGRVKLEGSVDGAIGYSSVPGLQGSIALHEAAVAVGDSPAMRFQEAQARLEKGVLTVSAESEAHLEAEYRMDTQALDMTISSAGMDIAALRAQAALAEIPLIEQMRAGSWKGKLRYQREGEAAGVWSGRVQLRDAEVLPPGMAEPLKIESANAVLQGGRVAVEKMHIRVGAIEGDGEYRYEPKLSRPHRFRIRLGAVSAAELEALALPTLRRDGFLARTLGIGRAPLPEWLAARRMDGTLEIESLQLGGALFERIATRVVWDGPRVEFSGLKAKWAEAALAGRVSADLSGTAPAYEIAMRVTGVRWKSGSVEADALLRARGMGGALFSTLRAEGSFSGLALDLETPVSLIGRFLIEWPGAKFTEIMADADGEMYNGSGALQEDGKLSITFSNAAKKQLRLTGTLAEPRLE